MSEMPLFTNSTASTCIAMKMFYYLPLSVHIVGRVQLAGENQPNGCNYRLEVPAGDPKILDRQVVKSEFATIKNLQKVSFYSLSIRGKHKICALGKPLFLLSHGYCREIPEIEFEIPPEAQRGSLSTSGLVIIPVLTFGSHFTRKDLMCTSVPYASDYTNA
ncbi:hypothetical protein F8388_026508 [Cannabis sativa]|uniref:Uncharacterized protein n=1 Tax=Cannabis sativa TaxID=3483 RepID=A0A7J6DTB7_CANSA|nr:hypothetical protein F8388_026508 [Cannabis sativa]